jgi:ABC-type phosphate transport system substrate-binding protein
MSLVGAILKNVALMALTLLAIYGACVLVLSLESHAPQAPSVNGKGSSSSQPAALLSFPLDYSASVTQSGDGIAEPRTRYYSAERSK